MARRGVSGARCEGFLKSKGLLDSELKLVLTRPRAPPPPRSPLHRQLTAGVRCPGCGVGRGGGGRQEVRDQAEEGCDAWVDCDISGAGLPEDGDVALYRGLLSVPL